MKKFFNQRIKCSTGEIANNYNEYLHTRHWNEMRVKIAKKFNYQCVRCNGIFKDNYHIHHNNYKNLGHEKESDLTFYCDRCHFIIHQNKENKRLFNRKYHTLFSNLMKDFNEEQIEEVLNFARKIKQKSIKKNEKT